MPENGIVRPFSPRSRGRKESDSANAYEPAWPAPAVGESGSAGQKRSWTPQELLICAHRATHGAKSRRKLESAKELHSGLFLACPKMYDLRAPNPLSGSASSSDIYLARGQFVGNYYVDSSGFLGVGFNPTALAIILFPSNLSICRGCKRRQREPRGWHQWLEGTSTSSIVLGSVTELASATVSGHTSTVDSLKLSSHRFQIGGICYQNLETQREQ